MDAGDNAAKDTPTGSSYYRAIVETGLDGAFVVDPDGVIIYVDDSLCSLLGRDRNELVGTTFETAAKSVLVGPEAYDRFATTISDISDGDVASRTLSFDVDLEGSHVLDIKVARHTREDGAANIVGVVRDVTERERRAEAAEQDQEVLAKLYEISGDASLTFDEKAERILAAGCAYLDLPYGFLTRIEDDVQQMVHTVGDHKLLQTGESVPVEQSYCRRTIKTGGLVGMEDARAELGADDPAYERFELGCYIGTKVVIGENLYGTFCFAGPKDQNQRFTPSQREVVKLLGQWSSYELERQQVEARLRGLHRTSQRLLLAETTAEVAETAVQVATELFALPMTACWEYDSDADLLCPLAETDEAVERVGETPTIDRGGGLIWESFDDDETRHYDDLTDRPGRYSQGTDARAEVHVPLGTHGVIVSAVSGSRTIDTVDIESLQLFGILVREAMAGVKREERLAERGEVLQEQNARLEKFVDVAAHDLRNPLTGAIGWLEIARQSDEAEAYDRVERSLERMDDLVGELLSMARGDRQPTKRRPVSLQSMVEEAWDYTDAGEATLSVESRLGEIQADEMRLLQLFGNLFRNSIEHCPDDVAVEVGRLPNGAGFYVADDGPGLTEDLLVSLNDIGAEDQATAIGIGLMSVTDIIIGHGWDLSVANTDRGLRFEVRTGEQLTRPK